VTDDQPSPSPQAYVRLNHFLRSGGMILFDTRDGDIAGLGGPDGAARCAGWPRPWTSRRWRRCRAIMC
jgi:hypothetical protein